MKRFFEILLLTMMVAASVRSATVGIDVRWNANPPEENVEKYEVKMSRVLPFEEWVIDVGGPTNPVFYVTHLTTEEFTNRISNVFPGRLYYPLPVEDYSGDITVSVRAVNSNGASAYSDSITLTVDTRRGPEAPEGIVIREIMSAGVIELGFTNLSEHFEIETTPTLGDGWTVVMEARMPEPSLFLPAVLLRANNENEQRFYRVVRLSE